MAKSTSKHKVTRFNLPKVEGLRSTVQLPFEHELFNLGGKEKDGTVGGKWFLRLLDCLKSVSGKTIEELRHSTHDLHPVNWENANTKCPTFSEQAEYWQFRIDKSHGRVIGILIDSVFYVVWLDPYHNLTDSKGYGGVTKFSKPDK